MSESTKRRSFNIWTTMILIVAGFAYASSYSLPYIKRVFYEPMMLATGANHTQMGTIMSVYGFGNVVSNLLGALIIDRLDYRKCIVNSLIATGILSIWLAVSPTVTSMYMIWISFGVSTFFVFNPAIFKLPRMVVREDEIGQSVGLFSFAQALGYIVIGFVSIFVYDLSIKTNEVAKAFSHVAWTYAIFTLLSAVVFHIVSKRVSDYGHSVDEGEKVNIKDILETMKEPALWLMIIAGFSLFTTMSTASYFVPYFGDVFGIAITFSGVLGLLNSYGGRFFSPLLGRIADKSDFTSKVVLIGIGMLLVLFILLLFYSPTVPVFVIIGTTLLVGILSSIFTNLCQALLPETGVPRMLSGAAMGLYPAVVYSPDLFQHALFGYWLDNVGNKGYTYMFIYTIIVLVVGGVASFTLYRRNVNKAKVA